MRVPLFPLNALVCPGGRLPLRVFEPRYLDMISRCLKEGTGFVVVMLREDESSAQPFYDLGTYAQIVDFGQSEPGIINVTAEGESRVFIHKPERQEDGLWTAKIEPANGENFVSLPDQYVELKEVLQALVQHPTVEELKMDIDYKDGRQVGWRLTELLPLDNAQKQQLLEMVDPISRLECISDQLSEMMS